MNIKNENKLVGGDEVSTVRRLRPACRPFFLRRFDELAAAALGERNDFSI